METSWTAAISNCFRAYFGREAEPGEIKQWLTWAAQHHVDHLDLEVAIAHSGIALVENAPTLPKRSVLSKFKRFLKQKLPGYQAIHKTGVLAESLELLDSSTTQKINAEHTLTEERTQVLQQQAENLQATLDALGKKLETLLGHISAIEAWGGRQDQHLLQLTQDAQETKAVIGHLEETLEHALPEGVTLADPASGNPQRDAAQRRLWTEFSELKGQVGLLNNRIEEEVLRGQESPNPISKRSSNQQSSDNANNTDHLNSDLNALKTLLNDTLLPVGEQDDKAMDVLARVSAQFSDPQGDLEERADTYLNHVHHAIRMTGVNYHLDIGCGFGDWLGKLAECGPSVGLDISPLAKEACSERGLECHLGDCVDFLYAIPASSVTSISLFHVAEHLPAHRLCAFLQACQQALAPQGILILETPDPRNLHVGAHTFWLDPEHKRPVPRLLMESFLKESGFDVATPVHLHPNGELFDESEGDGQLRRAYNESNRTFQDYGLIATKLADA